MKLTSNKSLSSLLRDYDQIMRELEAIQPVLAAQLKAVQLGIKQYEAGASKRFAHCLGTKAAVEECLKQKGEWMTKNAIANELLEGGFNMDPVQGVRLVVGAIGKYIERGQFLYQENGKQGKGIVGLLDWQGRTDIS